MLAVTGARRIAASARRAELAGGRRARRERDQLLGHRRAHRNFAGCHGEAQCRSAEACSRSPTCRRGSSARAPSSSTGRPERLGTMIESDLDGLEEADRRRAAGAAIAAALQRYDACGVRGAIARVIAGLRVVSRERQQIAGDREHDADASRPASSGSPRTPSTAASRPPASRCRRTTRARRRPASAAVK